MNTSHCEDLLRSQLQKYPEVSPTRSFLSIDSTQPNGVSWWWLVAMVGGWWPWLVTGGHGWWLVAMVGGWWLGWWLVAWLVAGGHGWWLVAMVGGWWLGWWLLAWLVAGGLVGRAPVQSRNQEAWLLTCPGHCGLFESNFLIRSTFIPSLAVSLMLYTHERRHDYRVISVM